MFLRNRKGGGDGGVEGAVWGETLQQELYPTVKKGLKTFDTRTNIFFQILRATHK